MQTKLVWDLFCRVVDNLGDVGVCWRLAVALAGRGQQVRLWVDDPSALAWMAPRGAEGVEVARWTTDLPCPGGGDVLVEAFGCEPAESFVRDIAHRAAERPAPVWINLEYLSAESYVARSHGLPSPLSHGPGRGLTRHFFFPGFTADTGGLLHGDGLAQRQARFDRHEWLRSMGIAWHGEPLVVLFCYEPPVLPAVLNRWAHGPDAVQLLVTPGRASAATAAALGLSTPPPHRTQTAHGALRAHWLAPLPQEQFDHLLWSADLNLVRGEDSLVRALLAARADVDGIPFLWQAYPQADAAHLAKLAAWLDWLQAPPDLRAAHAAWNTDVDADVKATATTGPARDAFAIPSPLPPPAWRSVAARARERVLAQDDLATRLIRFVMKKR